MDVDRTLFPAAIVKLGSLHGHLEVSSFIPWPRSRLTSYFVDHIITFTREGAQDYGCNVFE